MADLARFINDAAARGFEYGRSDCLLWLADWARLNGWRDPAYRWRGTYSTERECLRLVADEGGLFKIACKGFAQLPRLAEPDDAQPGDIGVGRFTGARTGWGDGELGLLRTPLGFAALTRRGVMVGPAVLVAAWRVQCPT
jgi:hypothetical protein